MASEATVQQIVDYISNLLIIQYSNKPKAKATIELMAREIVASGIVFDVENGYNVDTAVGVQLDVIGKYVGVDRTFQAQDLRDFFAFTYYDDVSPDAQDKWGFTNYANFDTLIQNGTLTYKDIILKDFSLNDEEYRILIKLKIIQNASNHSHKSIDDSIYQFFGNTIIPDSTGGMEMVYFVPSAFNQIILAAIAKGVLPRPMGVGISYISQSEPFFGFAEYGSINPHITGYADYSDYATKSGESFAYSKIS